MKTRLGFLALGLCFWLGLTRLLIAEDNEKTRADDEKLRAVKELLEQSIGWYDVLPDVETKAPLHPQAVLQWRNEVRINTGAAVLAIWTDHGRPEAMASIFQNGNDICHEFGSLSRSKKIVVRDTTRVVWSPGNAGVEFHDVPDAPVPAEDRAGRLRQMKSLTGRFEAQLPRPQVGNGNPEVLRLLPKALYRYDLKDSKESSLRDGGMFAFVMGTDPEVILLLEAIERDGKAVWQYAFARATAYAVEARLDDKVVWSVQPGANSPNSLFQVFRAIPK